MQTFLCRLKNGLAVYLGDIVLGYESPALGIRQESYREHTATHLFFENEDHVMISSTDPDIDDAYLIWLLT